ncbi:MAG: sulfatase-like hydrolase/transferase [Candidatus Aminicenantes bacterium]|jgi:arylsulfatase A-like enzyme/Flp pilus assembly protein TadD
MKQDKTMFGRCFTVLGLITVLFIGGCLFMQCSAKGTDIQHVVLISIGTCRADHLSCYGFNQPTTPNIDGIAAEGILFEKVISPVPITLPAHISMLTGITPLSHGVHDNLNHVLTNAELTLAEIFKNHDFVTGGIVSAFALDAKFDIAQGFDSYQDDFGKAGDRASAVERPGDETTQLAINWLQQHKNEKFFLFLHYNDPHHEYKPPEPYAARFVDDPYSGEIAFVDHCIGRVTAKLKELAIDDSTLLIITGDHGEMLGEHGEKEHSYFIYESAIKVPLIVKLPGSGSKKPIRIKESVGLIDVVPTICELLGFEIPPRVQGISLVPLLQKKELTPKKRYFYIESMLPTYLGANPLLGLRTDDWKYLHSTHSELYHLKNDPKEQINLMDKESPRARGFQDVLEKLLKEQQSAPPGHRRVPDRVTLNKLAALGYVGANVTGDTFTVDRDKPDPKDLIGLHQRLQRVQQLKFAKKLPEAKQMLEELGRQQTHFKVYDYLGEIALLENNIHQAFAYYSRSLQLNGTGYHANMDMGAIMSGKGKPKEAAAYFKKAMESHPYDTRAPRNLGIVLENMGKVKEACNYYLKVLTLNPKDTIALNHMGSSMLALGQEPEAMRYFMESIKVNPNQPAPLAWLAQIKTANPASPYYDPNGALPLILEACRLTQFNHPELLSLLVSVYTALGQVPQAIETAEQALKVSRAAGKQHLVQKLLQQLQQLKQTKPRGMENQ